MSETEMILQSEQEQGEAADLVVDLGLLDTAESHQANGCDCDFCIGYGIGLKAENLKARLRAADRPQPTAPPAESVKDAKAFVSKYLADAKCSPADEFTRFNADVVYEIAEQYAAKLLAERDKQTTLRGKCPRCGTTIQLDGFCTVCGFPRPDHRPASSKAKVLLVGHGSNPLREAMQKVMKKEDAKAFVQGSAGRMMASAIAKAMQAYAEQYASKQIERFVERCEYLDEINFGDAKASSVRQAFEEMQAVKG